MSCRTSRRNRRFKNVRRTTRLLKKPLPSTDLVTHLLSYVDANSSREYMAKNICEWFEINKILETCSNPFTMLCRDTSKKTFFKSQTNSILHKNSQETFISMYKYWQDRHLLFSLYDQGIQMDTSAWYSVTPELVALHQCMQAQALLSRDGLFLSDCLVVDFFAGIGGNTIQWARCSALVIALDNSQECAKMFLTNSKIYNVDACVDYIIGDIRKSMFRTNIKPDLVFMSPPWGGPVYVHQQVFDPIDHIKFGTEFNGEQLWNQCHHYSHRLITFLPRNTNIYQLAKLAKDNEHKDDSSFLIECNFIDKRFKGITVYQGFKKRMDE